MTAMLIGELELTMAQPPPPPPGCNERALTPCGPAILFGTAPSTECCRILRQQTPKCLCEYLRKYPGYAANARKAFRACGVPEPRC
ncbi:PREDICTED: probable non-specific lipid-transfer protein 2 [Ipomoea nil]|uniref:probable non-specific lipid-transfer protein 2 n=1 Tax=Ipomoea nil TaxID=35883 RepID=UPI000900E58D|nr:PREDICTED: probable non-specific lipid-transfer protein 2 [Ipomoea nil]